MPDSAQASTPRPRPQHYDPDGGAGSDTFVFGPGHGEDMIWDFEPGTDIIDLSGFNGSLSWEELSANITTVTNPFFGTYLQIDCPISPM